MAHHDGARLEATDLTALLMVDFLTLPALFEGLIVRYSRWVNALAAADFDVLLVRPSRSTEEASLAAWVEVSFSRDFACDRALAAAVLDLADVDLLCRVLDAFVAVLLLVAFDLAMAGSLSGVSRACPKRRLNPAATASRLRRAAVGCQCEKGEPPGGRPASSSSIGWVVDQYR